jgi:O-antigen ligase
MLIVVVIGLSEMLVEILLGIYRGREMGITGSLFIFPLILLAAQAFFNPKIKSSSRVAIILVGLFWCYWAYTNRVWKGGWAPVLVGLAVLAFIYSWRLTLLGSGVVAALVVWKWDFLSKMLLTMEVETTSTIRPYIWRDIANLVLPRSPVFGLGLANYKYYWNIPGFVPLSRIAAGWDKWNAWGYAIPSHNMFMDIFAQTGLLGIGLFLWGMGILLWIIIQVSRNLKPGFLRAYVLGVLAGFIAMLVGSFLFADWLIPFVYNITITGFRHSVYSWILVGSVVGIYYKQKEKRDASSS